MRERAFKRIIITGISGSGGSYLAEFITANHPEVEIHGIYRWHSTSQNRNIESILDKIQIHECDLNDLSSIIRVMKKVKPDGIFHLAAHANVRASFITPLAVLNNNVMGTANLLEAIRLSDIAPVIQICSTSEVYGQVDPKNVPIREDCPFNSASPYAVSKIAQDLLAYSYYISYGMKIIRTRMFAYLNPRRADLFATSFANQIVRIELGLQKKLLHGNLDSVRTLIDVRDAMESYWVALTKGKIGEVYNIGGLITITVGKLLNILKKKAKCKILTKIDPNLLRPADVTLQIPDVSKFQKETGWKPKYSFDESIEFLLDHCRSEIKKTLFHAL